MMRLPFAPSVFVEGATVAEAATLAEIHADAFRRTWSAHDFTALLSDPSVFALVARLPSFLGARRTVGFVLVRFAADEAEILTIAVRSRYRRRGYGRLLMEDVIRRLYRERIARLFLEVERANAAAVGLYRSLGFTVAGERKNYYSAPTATDGGTALVMRLQVR
ncbi:MAG: ribosomal protein S18-alanine N-acetyltransferase [Bauldia sp.]|jgi:ribosomal-protein-alanine N-acetyltransferase|nr:ribosomal protein S18-alanine N-acetyltransferase [Bauldia sp.]